ARAAGPWSTPASKGRSWAPTFRIVVGDAEAAVAIDRDRDAGPAPGFLVLVLAERVHRLRHVVRTAGLQVLRRAARGAGDHLVLHRRAVLLAGLALFKLEGQGLPVFRCILDHAPGDQADDLLVGETALCLCGAADRKHQNRQQYFHRMPCHCVPQLMVRPARSGTSCGSTPGSLSSMSQSLFLTAAWGRRPTECRSNASTV